MEVSGSYPKAVCILLTKRLAVLLLLACAGCSAQNPAQNSAQSVSPELKTKIQRQIQAQYDLPPEVAIEVGPRHPSDFPTYDLVTVTLVGKGHEQKVDFLLSQDGKTLAKVTKMDLTKDIYTERMNEIDVRDVRCAAIRTPRSRSSTTTICNALSVPACTPH